MQRGWSQALVSSAQGQDKRQQAQAEAEEVGYEHQQTLLYCEGDWAPAGVAPRGGGGSHVQGGARTVWFHLSDLPLPFPGTR